MRCKNCDYRLWNLTTNRCPECGTTFAASDYEFAPNSVAFCCPQCGQDYYGTGDKGHLVPAEFDCVACGRHVHMNNMVLRPAAGVNEEQTEAERLPWFERKKIGFVRAWFATLKMALIKPGRLMQLVPATSPIATAVWFAVFTHILMALCLFLPMIVVFLLMSIPARGGGMTAVPVFGGMAIGYMMMAAIFVPVALCLWGGCAHLVLRLTGGTPLPFGRTFQAIAYSSGANVVSAIPCCGTYFGWIWWMVSAILAVREAQQVGGGRATAAVLALPVISIGGMFALMITIASFAPTPTGVATTSVAISPTATPAKFETQMVLDALLAHARKNKNQPPAHAAMLIAEQRVPLTLFAMRRPTLPDGRPRPLPGSLADLDKPSDAVRRAAAETAAKALPSGTIAHRLGDFVFTYHGIDLAKADPQLWLVVAAPDPDGPQSPGSTLEYAVGRANGSSTSIRTGRIAAELKKQNALRAKNGLPPLPRPETVRHLEGTTKPNVAPPGPEADDAQTPEAEKDDPGGP